MIDQSRGNLKDQGENEAKIDQIHSVRDGTTFGKICKKRTHANVQVKTLTLSQGLATLFLLIMSIGVNVGLRTLVARGHHLPLLSKWYDQYNF